MPLIIMTWGILYISFGGVININFGLGYDGYYYGKLVQNFYEQLLGDQLSWYRIQKIVPSFVINSFMTALEIPKKTLFIVKAFQIYNLILLIICSFFWYGISKLLKLKLRFIWLGFILWFLNFGIAEFTFFNPVLTDTTSFFLGFGLLFFHFKNNLILKLIITFIGAFTWGSFIYFGLLLIIFPITFKINSVKWDFRSSDTAKKFISLLIPLPFLIVAVIAIAKYFATNILYYIDTPVIEHTLYISAGINYLVMAYALASLLPDKIPTVKLSELIRNFFTETMIRNIMIAVIFSGTVYALQTYLSNDKHEDVSFSIMFYLMAVYSSTKLLVYILTAITYFGPVFIIYFIFFKRFKANLINSGFGIYISFVIAFFLLFITEPRMIINFFPVIVLLTVLVLKDLNAGKKVFAALFLTSLFLSKIYVPMFDVMSKQVDKFTFPNQLAFMNTYLISPLSYFIQLPVVIVLIAWVYFVIRKECKVVGETTLSHG